MCWKRQTPQETPQDTPQVKEIKVLDPRGMIRNDIEFIRKHLPKVGWHKDSTLEEIAYNQGQHDLLHFIETKVINRRMDHGPLTPKTKEATGSSRESLRKRTQQTKANANRAGST